MLCDLKLSKLNFINDPNLLRRVDRKIKWGNQHKAMSTVPGTHNSSWWLLVCFSGGTLNCNRMWDIQVEMSTQKSNLQICSSEETFWLRMKICELSSCRRWLVESSFPLSGFLQVHINRNFSFLRKSIGKKLLSFLFLSLPPPPPILRLIYLIKEMTKVCVLVPLLGRVNALPASVPIHSFIYSLSPSVPPHPPLFP